MGNPFCHLELTTHDRKGAQEFYAKLFDWKLSELPGPISYTMVDTGKEPGGGIMDTPEPGVPTCWTMYIEVEDVEAASAQVEKLGGKVWKPKTEVPEYGWFAVVCDPQGAYFGLWHNKK